MSNILIIKHGSLGDIAQISGVLQDIRQTHKEDKIFILTTHLYIELLGRCPFVDFVLLDKRLPRWNIFYLLKLRTLIHKTKFKKVYDLQNSSRTSFYRRFLFDIKNWSSTQTTLKKGDTKDNFDTNSVLARFQHQLEESGVISENTLKPNFSWACENVDNIVSKYFSGNFILLFPFCSPNLPHKKWPYFQELIQIIKSKHNNLEVVIAPGPNEIEESKKFNATVVLNQSQALNMMELSGLIKKSKFVIANDTGPAHISAHLGKSGVALFGSHTSPKKVSIETENFKTLISKKLENLSAEKVYFAIKDKLII